jgi:predicted nucleic acid-binding protein
MTVILDSSAGIEIVLSRPNSEKFMKVLSKAKKVVSSDLFKIEIANTLWKYVKAKFISKEKANEALRLAQELVDEFIDIANNNEEAMNESIRLHHSTYDLLYFTLARRLGASLLTLDKKLIKLAEDAGISIVK